MCLKRKESLNKDEKAEFKKAFPDTQDKNLKSRVIDWELFPSSETKNQSQNKSEKSNMGQRNFIKETTQWIYSMNRVGENV